MKSAREAALLALVNLEKTKSYSNIELKREFKLNELNENDKALFKQLFFGTLENKYYLDYHISKISSIKLHKMSPYVINILRTGFYQLIFLNKIPKSAACNEAVKLGKKYSKSSAGFINAVMRNYLRKKDNISLPDKEMNPIEYYSIKYSINKWIVSSFVDKYGEEETEKILNSFFDIAPITAHINTLKTNYNDLAGKAAVCNIELAPHNYMDCAAKINYSINIEKTSVYKEGLFHLQGIASQLCCSILSSKPGHTVLDICAAPGGKSFTIAEMMNDKGTIFSNDKYEHKVKLIEIGAKRLGINIIKTICSDATLPLPIKVESCDRVLCDVPCSGLGVIAKRPEIRYKKEQDIKGLPVLQLKILNNAARYLKKGGLLVYSTCTLNSYENEGVLFDFLKENPDFELIDINDFLPPQIKSTNTGCITLLPHIHETDGFFISLMKRKNG